MNKMPFSDEQMNEMGYSSWRMLEDGTILAVGSMLFNNGRLFIDVNHHGYDDCYCYDSVELAHQSMMSFDEHKDAEPEGWKRHPSTGRRREGGDKKKQVVRF